MTHVYDWFSVIALLAGIFIYMHTEERREHFLRNFGIWLTVIVISCGVTMHIPLVEIRSYDLFTGVLLYLMTLAILYSCWVKSWSSAAYTAIWVHMSWQLLMECCDGLEVRVQRGLPGEQLLRYPGRLLQGVGLLLIVFLLGYLIVGATIARWMPAGGPKKIGPRQLASAILIFGTFELLAAGLFELQIGTAEHRIIYLSQLFLALILYLQSELFKKSAMRQELAVMNMLWRKEQEQYRLSRDNIALVNQKCHDLKHQIRAIRNMTHEELEAYLAEVEDTVQIYEAIVKTGNEVLDTILTEKSLYCKEKGITVSCVADGCQMDFIHTVDLYAILGNAMDNAIEAVETFTQQEKRQIDVLIYKQQQFLVINIINPMQERLIYEEELPVTTKGDKGYHGYGLKSIRYLVKKYNGYLSVQEEDSCFSLKILIPIPKQENMTT